MTIESHADGEALGRVGRVASLVLEEMLDALEPGMTTAELDAIGRAVQRTARAHRPRVIENLGSHGVGRVLREGMVITIEPFLSTRSRTVVEAADGWTLPTAPDNLSAQYEHTTIITRGAPIVVTTHGGPR